MSDSKQLVPVDEALMRTPGLMKRLTQAVTYALRGGFFSPETPMRVEHQETAGRRFDYPAGYNLNIRPRRESGITFETLRAFSKAYDLLRIIIETRKDQVCGFDWSIMPTDEDAKVTPTDETMAMCNKIADFFKNPADGLDWNAWLRVMLEDCFVIDGIALWPTYKGKGLQALEIIDSSTIKIVVDESGRVASPPYPAYQQVLKGIPANEYRKDELHYFIRNPMSNSVYGYSHVEQIIMTVNIGLRREKTQLSYFTEGNIPEAIAGLPETWTPEQIAQFQTYWDTMLAGNMEKRVGNMRFVPGDANKINMIRKDEATLKGEFDEWLARIICYTFSVSPIPFIKQTNRSVAESMQEVAKEEGLLPLLHFLRRIMNHLIKHGLKVEGYEFKWNLREDVDPETQNKIDMEELEHGVISIDDIRKRKGLEVLGVPEMIWTNSGPVPVSMFIDGSAPNLQPPEPPPTPGEEEQDTDEAAKRDMEKYSDDQPRGDNGQWSGGGGGSEGGGGGGKNRGNKPNHEFKVYIRELDDDGNRTGEHTSLIGEHKTQAAAEARMRRVINMSRTNNGRGPARLNESHFSIEHHPAKEARKRIAGPFPRHYGQSGQALTKRENRRGYRAPRWPGIRQSP